MDFCIRKAATEVEVWPKQQQQQPKQLKKRVATCSTYTNKPFYPFLKAAHNKKLCLRNDVCCALHTKHYKIYIRFYYL